MEVKKNNKNEEKAEGLTVTHNKSSRSAVVRSLSFTPLRLNLLQKDILEAVNEPLSTVEDVFDSDEDRGEEENIIPQDRNKSESYSTESKGIKSDSVDSTDKVCSMFGGKVKKVFMNRDDQPQKFLKTTELPINSSHMVDINIHEHGPVLRSTENNIQTGPRIQCSIEMNSLLKTPLNNLKPLQNPSARKLKMPIKLNGGTSVHINGEELKTYKLFGSIKKQNYQEQKNNQPKNTIHSEGLILGHSLNSTSNSFMFNVIILKHKTYIIIKELGRGGSSVVYFCLDPLTMEERALKKVFLSRAKSSGVEYINEVEILRKLQKCNRIIRMYDSELQEHSTEGNILWVVLEKGGIDLDKILKKVSGQEKPLAYHVIIFYWMEMLYAVKQIHENGIIHSDLKPANFIKAETTLKLIDFGIASSIQSDMTSIIKNVAIGSFDYISPEALFNENNRNSAEISSPHGNPKFKISFKSDVWSLGCILYQLLFGTTPFQHIGNTYAKLSTIMDPNHEIMYPDVDNVPKNLLNTVKRCLQYNAKQRPSVDELIKNFEY